MSARAHSRLIVRSDDQRVNKLDRQTLIVSGVVVVGVIMSILDTTIVNVALDTLARELHASLGTVQWVATGYLLALAIVIPLTGWMSERFGSRRLWIISVSLFAAGSALCGAAPNVGLLIFFRVLQGLGGGMIMPLAMTVLAQAAGPARIGRLMSVVGIPMLLGPILGPVIGGFVVDNASWRWIFYVNVPVAVLAVVLALLFLPRGDEGRANPGPLDWIGTALLSPGLAAIVFGLAEVEQRGGIGHPLAFGPIVGGAGLVALFVRHALHAERPLIDVRLFRSPTFSAAAATTFLIGAALFGALLLLPLYYQLDRGETALSAGLLIAPQGIGAALAMPFTGRLADRGFAGPTVLVGASVMTLATLPFVFVGAHTSYVLLAAALVVRGLGVGAAMMPAMAAAYAALEPHEVPRATSALNALQRVGGSIGTALLAVVLQHQMHAVAEPSPGTLAGAFGHTFAWATGLMALGLLPALLLTVRRRSSPAHPVPVESVT